MAAQIAEHPTTTALQSLLYELTRDEPNPRRRPGRQGLPFTVMQASTTSGGTLLLEEVYFKYKAPLNAAHALRHLLCTFSYVFTRT
jgi:hypothetical protein